MIENNVVEWSGRETDRDALTELIRTAGARYSITKALQAEVSKLVVDVSRATRCSRRC